ncbi:MAG: hypothetical protein WA005_00845 [Candidatus Binataceae bacterium]
MKVSAAARRLKTGLALWFANRLMAVEICIGIRNRNPGCKRFADERDRTSFDPDYDTLPLEHFAARSPG